MQLPLSLQLWQILANPPYRHPLYRRNAVPRVGPEWLQSAKRVLTPLAPTLFLFGIGFVCCSITSRSLELLLMLGALAVFLFNGTLFGLGWSLGIAGELAATRERHAYDLLCLLPGGALGVMWATASGTMHREGAFRKRHTRHRILLIAIMVVLLFLSLGALFGQRNFFNGDVLVMYAAIFGALGASYGDYVQSVVLSGLVGVLAAEMTTRRVDAEIGALVGFLTLQVATYALAAVVGFALLPPLLESAGLTGWPRDLLLVVLRVAVLLGGRELLIGALWRRLADRLNTSRAQLDALVTA